MKDSTYTKGTRLFYFTGSEFQVVTLAEDFEYPKLPYSEHGPYSSMLLELGARVQVFLEGAQDPIKVYLSHLHAEIPAPTSTPIFIRLGEPIPEGYAELKIRPRPLLGGLYIRMIRP